MYCFSLGNHEVSELVLGTIAAEQLGLAIVDAVKQTEILMPSSSESMSY